MNMRAGVTPVPISRTGAATLVIVANAVSLLVFLQGRADRLLAAVVDPLHPDWSGMRQAFAAFTVYAVSMAAVLAIGALLLGRAMVRRARRSHGRGWGATKPPPGLARRMAPSAALAALVTAVVVLVFIEVLLFQDYGVHLYEFDVFGIFADAALRRDLGIQPAEVLRVSTAAIGLLAGELVLFWLAARISGWRNGALARASAAAMLIAVPGGLALFRVGEETIVSDRAEFEGALPFGRQLLLRDASRPFIAVAPRLGAGGYPVLSAHDMAPTLTKRANIVFFVADGLRGDMFKPDLTPHLSRFASRPDVIHSRLHFSTGHVSEAGIFGLVYGLNGQSFHAFIESRVPAYPLEVLKRNGYHTFLLASSRLSPYPSDQLIRGFDEVAYPRNDDEAIVALSRYVNARRADGRPYFVLGFFYTPHYPFTSAKPHLRRYPLVGPKARPNYMNDVIQADDYFRQTLDIVGKDFEEGRTVVLGTSDHGEEIRDHGVFGHASATFWNEKIVVPFVLGLPGAKLPAAVKEPSLTSHVDVWPTLFEYFQATPNAAPSTFSDGRSLLQPAPAGLQSLVTGRFFPFADRPNVLVDDTAKYWFRVSEVGANNRLCVVVTRVTDLHDRTPSFDPSGLDARMIPAFDHLQNGFWRFIRPVPGDSRSERRIC